MDEIEIVDMKVFFNPGFCVTAVLRKGDRSAFFMRQVICVGNHIIGLLREEGVFEKELGRSNTSRITSDEATKAMEYEYFRVYCNPLMKHTLAGVFK